MQSRAQPQDWKSAAFWLPALIAVIFVAFIDQVLNDGDVFWHIHSGEWILDHRSVPVTDPFSYTFFGQPWHVHEWLSEVMLALAWRAGGWGGVILLCALAVGLAMGLLNNWLTGRLGALGAAVASMLVFSCLEPSLLARPHLLAIPLLVVWTRVLLDSARSASPPRATWLLLLVIWSNLHGSVLFAVGLTGLFALDQLLARPADWRSTISAWAPFCIGAAAAVLVTPSGLEGALFLVKLTQMDSLQFIREWQPTDIYRFQAIHLIVLSGLGLVLYRRLRLRLVPAAILVLLLVMALEHQRHQMLLAIIGTMLLSDACGERLNGESGKTAPRWLTPLAAALLALVALARIAIPFQPREGSSKPFSAFAHVPRSLLGQPVLNGYDAGGLLISRGVRTYIDGRTDLYGDAFVKRYKAIIGGDQAAIDQAISQYGITWTFLPTESGAVDKFNVMPGWRRLYSDKFVTVHVRNEKGPG